MLGEIAALRAKVKDSEEAVEREKQAAEDERRRADTDQLRKIKQLEHQCKRDLCLDLFVSLYVSFNLDLSCSTLTL